MAERPFKRVKLEADDDLGRLKQSLARGVKQEDVKPDLAGLYGAADNQTLDLAMSLSTARPDLAEFALSVLSQSEHAEEADYERWLRCIVGKRVPPELADLLGTVARYQIATMSFAEVAARPPVAPPPSAAPILPDVRHFEPVIDFLTEQDEKGEGVPRADLLISLGDPFERLELFQQAEVDGDAAYLAAAVSMGLIEFDARDQERPLVRLLYRPGAPLVAPKSLLPPPETPASTSAPAPLSVPPSHRPSDFGELLDAFRHLQDRPMGGPLTAQQVSWMMSVSEREALLRRTGSRNMDEVLHRARSLGLVLAIGLDDWRLARSPRSPSVPPPSCQKERGGRSRSVQTNGRPFAPLIDFLLSPSPGHRVDEWASFSHFSHFLRTYRRGHDMMAALNVHSTYELLAAAVDAGVLEASSRSTFRLAQAHRLR